MTLPKPAPVTSCCGFPVRTWHSQSDTVADETLCDDCGAYCCSRCAAAFSREDGYDDDGQGVRTHAICQSCAKPEPSPVEPIDDRDFQDVPNGD